MYLWKYWRESRILFSISLALIATLFAAFFHGHFSFAVQDANGGNSGRPDLSQILIALFYMQILPLGFLGWLMGSYGTGRDLGENSGSFLLTRPRRRAWFLWHDWGFGITQLIVITVLFNLCIYFLAVRFLPYPETVQQPSAVLSAIVAVGGALFAGLIFSVTYFSTIVVKHARGVMLGLGLFVGYLILGAIVHHYWEAIQFPSLLLPAFHIEHNSIQGLTDHLGLQIAVRIAVIFLFPVAAQLLLDRAEV